MAESPEIFFHVGLGKTGTTYLQYRFFPKLKDIKYIQRTLYRDNKYMDIINQKEYDKYLISNEFDQALENELKKNSTLIPDAKIIMMLRRQDGWVASQYRRFVKNGKSFSIDGYLDIKNDKGWWKIDEFYFFKKIQLIQKYFHQKPLILFHEDFTKDPVKVFDQLAAYMGVNYDLKDINLVPKHKSHSEKKLKVMRKFGSKFFDQDKTYSKNYYIRKLQTKSKMILVHLILNVSFLIPESWIGKEPLIPKEKLDAIAEFYEEDWNACLKFAGENNPV